MPDFEERHLDFVVKCYRKGAFDTKAAIVGFHREIGYVPGVTRRKKAIRWIYAVSAVAAAFIIGLFVHMFQDTGRWTVLAAGSLPAVCTLPDSSVVTLAPGSSVSYDARHFGIDGRQVRMDGKVFFDVSPDKDRPFEITSDKMSVKVLGTRFLVDRSSGGRLAMVYVEEGTVYFSGEEKSEGVILEKGMSAVLADGAGAPDVQDVCMVNSIAWVRGSFIFEDTPLRDALREIAGFYGVSLAASDLDKTITGEFDTEDLDIILGLIEDVLDIRIVKQ